MKTVERFAALSIVAAAALLGGPEAEAGGHGHHGGHHRGGPIDYNRAGGFGLARYPRPWLDGVRSHRGRSVGVAPWFCRSCSAYHVGRCPRR